jgi:diadenylate cyclase
VTPDHHADLERAIALVAPGRPLREGLDRIVRAGMGALIIVGDGPEVLELCSGGFELDAVFSPQRLSEIAKMDGAVILSNDLRRIMRANVHLVPDPNLPTSETGTRHRTAERVARALNLPVISVSERMTTITIYLGPEKYPLDPLPRVQARANQALSALERYRSRHDTVMASLSALEVQDLVTIRDVASALQRAEMVVRIADEVEGYVLELGTDGRMIRLQMVELVRGVAEARNLVVRDYVRDDPDWSVDDALGVLSNLETDRLVDLDAVAATLRLGSDVDDLDTPLAARGYRMRSRIRRFPRPMADRVVAHFHLLTKLLAASPEDLEEVEGMGALRARNVASALGRLAQASVAERYG